MWKLLTRYILILKSLSDVKKIKIDLYNSLLKKLPKKKCLKLVLKNFKRFDSASGAQ